MPEPKTTIEDIDGKLYERYRLPDGPLYGSKEMYEKGWFIMEPGIEVLVEVTDGRSADNA